MPSTKCIYDKVYVLLNLVTKKCSCLYMLRQGPYITVYIYTERYAIMRSIVVLLQSASEATRIVIKYQLCVKTNSCVFNCKLDNKNGNPENLLLFMALVKKGPFFIAFYGDKI